MTYIPIGSPILDDIQFNGSGWLDLSDMSSSYGELILSYNSSNNIGSISVDDSTIKNHIAGRTSATVGETGVYVLTVNCKSNLNSYLLNFLLGGDNKSLIINNSYNYYSVDLNVTDIITNGYDRLGIMVESGNTNTSYYSMLRLYESYYLGDVSNLNMIHNEITNKYDLTWDLYDNNGVLVAYSSDGVFGLPTGGYSVGETIVGGGDIVYIGNLTSLNRDIINGNYNYYKIWSHKVESTIHYYSSGETIFDVGSVINFDNTIINNNSVYLNWDLNSIGDDVLLVWSNNTMSFRPVDGQQYNVGYNPDSYSEIIYKGNSTGFTHDNLVSSDTNLYFIWSYDSSYNYSVYLSQSVKIISYPVNCISNSISVIENRINWNKVDNNDVMVGWSNNRITIVPNGDYNVGDTIGSGSGSAIVLYKGGNLVYNHIHNNGETCWYMLWSYKDVNGNTIYSDGVELYTPGSAVNFNASKYSSDTIKLTWDLNNDNNDVIICYSNGSVGNLEDEVNYNVGDNINGGGVVIYKGSLLEYDHNNLSPNTYNYKIWSVYRDKYSYFMFDNIELTSSDVGDPLFFNAVSNNLSVNLSWSLYNNLDVLLSSNNVNLFGIPIGDYNVGDVISGGGSVIYKGNNVNYIDNINNGETRYYKIWSYDSDNIYSDGVFDCIIGDPINFRIDKYGIGGKDLNVFWVLNNLKNDIVLLYSESNVGDLVDGIEYKENDILQDGGVVVYVGSGFTYSGSWMKLNDSIYSLTLPLQINEYKFRIYSVGINNRYSNYLEISGSTIYIVEDPLNFDYLYVSDDILKLLWSLNLDNNDIIIAKNINGLFGKPVKSYDLDDYIIGGGQVIYKGNSNNLDINNISKYKSYYYKIWSYVECDGFIYYSDGVYLNIVGQIKSVLSKVIDCSRNEIKFYLNDDNNNVMIVSSGSSIGTPLNGDIYDIGDILTGGGEVVYLGDNGYFLHDGLNDNTLYNYKLFSISEDNFYSKSIDISLKTDKKVYNPNNFNINYVGGVIKLTWSLNLNSDDIRLSYSYTNRFNDYSDCGTDDTYGNILLDDSNSLLYDHHINLIKPFVLYYKIWSIELIDGKKRYSSGVEGYIYISDDDNSKSIINDKWDNDINWKKQ